MKARRVRWRLAAGVTLAATLAGCGAAARPPGTPAAPGTAPARTFADSSLWDDGRAEIATYRGTTRRYGIERPTTARIIVVKEDLLEGPWVKSDAGPRPGRTVEALKMNLILDFPTGTYDYHWMVSVFARRAGLEPIREVMSSAEGCGITHVSVAPRGGRLTQRIGSYWEGEAEQERPVVFPAGPALWADALPLALRAWAGAADPLEWRVWLLPSQLGSRSPDSSAVPLEATVRRVGRSLVAVPQDVLQAVHFSVTSARGTDLFWFDSDPPHVLLKMETADGRRLERVNAVRLDYWNHTHPGEEALLLE
jgi:hypothetical protein